MRLTYAFLNTGRHRNVLAIQSHPEYTRRILETRLCPGTVPLDFKEGQCIVAFVRAFVGDWSAIQRVLLLHQLRQTACRTSREE